MLPNVLPNSVSDHTPVLADEVRRLLAVEPGETVVDATFGAGGHARLLAADLQGNGKLVAIDRDRTVKAHFDRFKAQAGVDVRFLRGDFAVVLAQLAANDVKADAILLDIGVSSMQIDRPERGFSYATDAPLDMRMDPSGETTAATIVNTWDERELATIFRRFGEERYAKQIARAIVRRRAERPFFRTGDLVDVIKSAIPTPARFGEGHPAKRVFQALRIAVNDELGQLEAALPAAVEMLRPGGRVAVDQLPLARGPDREAVLRGAFEGLHLPAGLPGLRLRQGAGAAPAHPEARAAVRGRGGREPARRVRASPGGGQDVDVDDRRSRHRPARAQAGREHEAAPLALRGRDRLDRRRRRASRRDRRSQRRRPPAQHAVRRAQPRARAAEGRQRAPALAAVERLGQRPDRGRRHQEARPRGGRPADHDLRAAAREVRDRRANHRIRLLLAAFGLLFAVAIGRAAWVQAAQHDRYAKMAVTQHRETIEVPAGRGTIYDRTGEPLAIGEQATTVYADPRNVVDAQRAAIVAAKVLGLDADTLYPELKDRSKGFVYVARKADPLKAADAEQA